MQTLFILIFNYFPTFWNFYILYSFIFRYIKISVVSFKAAAASLCALAPAEEVEEE